MKTVIVTGASSGFGLDMVKLFLDGGWKVIATMRKLDQRKVELKGQLDLDHKNLILAELDVAINDSLDSFIESVDAVDVLINNAGFGTYGALEDVSEEQIRYQMEVNYFGPVKLIKGLLPKLRSSKGKIINISSLMGRYACPLSSVYSSSKYALEGLSEGLMYELKPFGIDVATIQPGGHRTNFVKSVAWGENSFSKDSPYRQQTDGFKGMMDKLSARTNAPKSETVAQKAYNLATTGQMPRKVVVGKDAKFVALLQGILPSGAYRKLMFASNKKIFEA